MTLPDRLTLPNVWVNAESFERAFLSAGPLLNDRSSAVEVIVLPGCKIMVDAATRLLSLLNQLAMNGQSTSIIFKGGADGAMSYLDRIGFFDHLSPYVEVLPDRPATSAHAIYKGGNAGLVELRPINPFDRDRTLPKELADSLENACSDRSDSSRLGHATYTVFAELIDNIFEHSATKLNGYAALQVYNQGNAVVVAVSDSGSGILETIRPSLTNKSLMKLSDPDLIIHLFNVGTSRFGEERGLGLRQCASNALQYSAELWLRLPESQLHLVPTGAGYIAKGLAYSTVGLPKMLGTHFSFRFRLDSSAKSLVKYNQ